MSQTVDVGALFDQAHNDGNLTGDALKVLKGVQNIGAQINAGLGTPALQVQSTESVLVAALIDDSGSIAYGGYTQAVIDGHNGIVEALKKSKQANDVLFYSRLLNSNDALNPFRPLGQVELLDRNFRPRGGTPLYDQALVVLATAMAKYQEFADNAIPARVVVVLVTDGADTSSVKRVREVAALVNSMLGTEAFLIIGIGIGSSPQEEKEFRVVFESMGLLSQWILTTSNNESDIRRAFMVASQSAVRASQNAASFSQAALGGGFASP